MWSGFFQSQTLTDFADGLDALIAISADKTVESIKDIAEDIDSKKLLDAWRYLDRRALKVQDALDAADVEPDGETAVAHI